MAKKTGDDAWWSQHVPTYRLDCRTCGRVISRRPTAKRHYEYRFPLVGQEPLTSPLPERAPWPECREHKRDALCRYFVEQQSMERREEAVRFFPPDIACCWFTMVMPNQVVPLKALHGLDPVRPIRYAKRVIRRALKKLPACEGRQIRIFGHLDISLRRDRDARGKSQTLAVPHIHMLVAGVAPLTLQRIFRGELKPTFAVPKPTEIADVETASGAIQYARKHIDDIWLKEGRAETSFKKDVRLRRDGWRYLALRAWFGRQATTDFEFLMGLQRRKAGIIPLAIVRSKSAPKGKGSG